MAWNDEIVRRRGEQGKAINYSLPHLKVFEFSGFLGCRSEVELVKYFLENATALERIIIDPRGDLAYLCCWELDCEVAEDTEAENGARRRAKQQLYRLVPSHVELVIL
ncbi:hypothetical protein ACH5RR_034240 [Cinchona calisaya]|uniref:FBD domain-containing protein n=1 Tax=Cinchona calisaya TaxID=153742 RepID=A0ABD2YE64_9GENT